MEYRAIRCQMIRYAMLQKIYGAPADGSSPSARLIQATDGHLYGTTYLGANGYGTVFRITPSGKLTTLYGFCTQSNCTVFASYADISIVSLLVPATVVFILSMAIEAQRGKPFVFCIPPPLSRRVIPLVYTAFLLLCAAYIPLKVGLGRFSEGFGNHPDWRTD